jgi:UDP-N-acetylmuramate dehydrogenase
MMAARANLPLRGELRVNASLKGLNSWRVGGPAERLYRPADIDDLSRFLNGLEPREPLTWLGLGTNLLVRDGGVRGTVIGVHGALNGLAITGPARVTTQAGVPCAKLARFCAQAGYAGTEFMVGIPGTIGGALAMNAGAFGAQTWDVVAAVCTVDPQGRIRRRDAGEFGVGYRDMVLPAREWFVAAEIELKAGDKVASLARIRGLLARRQASQPLGVASCGSVFRNPPGDFAARLIETAGLKGHRIGGASVSERHANFIINDSSASAADIEALIRCVQLSVEGAHSVALVPEVRVIGEPVITL